MDVAAGTIVIWSDIACPWATLAVHRLRRERDRLGDRLGGEVVIDHRAFPLELVNSRATPRRVLMAELPVAGALEPEFGWQMWRAPESEWPVTTLLALEAVQAAKDQSLAASEALDLALRRAFFVESRCVSLRHVVLDVAGATPEVDADALTKALDDGRARHAVVQQWHDAVDGPVDRAVQASIQGSPHLFLADGSDQANPGIELHWEGEPGRGFPVVDADDPSIYERILPRATAQRAGSG
jgi:predicted DsbA family dithiol-disulfide isomerase